MMMPEKETSEKAAMLSSFVFFCLFLVAKLTLGTNILLHPPAHGITE
jgi:hypothetical protein